MTVIQPWRPGSNRLWGEASISPGYVEAWESSLEFGQVQLGVNVYGNLRGMTGPDSPSIRLVHAAPNSTSITMKHKGHGPAVISGTHLVDGDDLVAFINDIRDGHAERKFMWVLGASPVYAWVYSGDIVSITPLNFYGSAGRKYDVTWRFILSQSKVHWVSDDTVAWGA